MDIDSYNISNIEVLTVAKVASSAFLRSCNNTTRTVSHGHSLLRLTDVLRNKRNTLIISGIRNPLIRNISYFFQTHSDQGSNDVKTQKNNYQGETPFVCSTAALLQKTPEEVIDLFFAQNYHFTFNDWFEEFFLLTEIKDIPFNKQRSYQLYPLGKENYLLMYTMENLGDTNVELARFLKIEKLLHTNSAKESPYHSLYEQVKKKIKFPDAYKQQLLDTSIMKYFYTPSTVNGFYGQGLC